MSATKPRLGEMTREEMAAIFSATPAPSLKIKTGQTYPPFQAYVTDNNGPFDLTSVSVFTFAMKGVTTGPLVTGSGVSQQVAFTGTTSNNSPTLTAVSSFSGLFLPELDGSRPGSILIGPNIAPPVYQPTTKTWLCTTILSWNQGAGTILMSANATGAGTANALVGNQGLLQYSPTGSNTSTADTYLVEWKLTLSGGGILFVPSESDLNQSIEIDSSLGE